MKNIVYVAQKNDIHDYINSLWKTDLFRTSHASGGFAHGIVERFSRLPRFFYDMSDVRAEQAHFSVWWGGIGMRDYANDYSHDLYLLHDFVHGGSMTYIADQNLECFTRKITDNEMYSSIMTEVISYFAMPELRAVVPFKDIFADRFLQDKTYQQKWNENPEGLIDELYYRRRRAMLNPTQGDVAEKWLNYFMQQNAKWFSVWERQYNRVETRMEQLGRESVTGSRKDALRRHMDWLLSDTIAMGGAIPFPVEAKDFADVYWEGRARLVPPHKSVA